MELNETLLVKSTLKETMRRFTNELHASIADAITKHPEKTYRQIAAEHLCSEATVLKAAAKYGITRPTGPRPKASSKEGEHKHE